jgi:polar amino acid transport system substrate-binding protein
MPFSFSHLGRRLAQPTPVGVIAVLGLLIAVTPALAVAARADSRPARPVTSVPPSQLVRAHHFTVCSDFPSPPQEFYSANGVAEGSDIDTGNRIAALLGLHPTYVNSVFDTIIAALTSGKCDVIISGMFITPERAKQISFVPYLTSGQQLLVLKGNPEQISDDYQSLCGKTISTELGGAETTTAAGLSKKCKGAGKPGITVSVPTKTDVALEEVITHKAAAFFEDSPVVGYYAHQSPTQFDLIRPAIDLVQEGIGIAKNKPALYRAVKTALKKMESDGSYNTVLAKWGLQGTKIPRP